MNGREQRNLQGPVKTVVWETFDWDNKAGAVRDKPSRREELTFSPQGNLVDSVSQFLDRPIQRMTYVYDEGGRLRATRWRNSDGTEGGTEIQYDQYGQPIRYGANVTYSFENGRRVKAEVLEAKTPGVDRPLGFGDAASRMYWSTSNAAVATTFYDARERPAEMVVYDDEHVQISKIVRTYDERGRVTSEENQMVSPRLFTGQRGAQGEVMPKEVAQLFARAFSQSPMRMIYKYDDHDRVTEQTQEMGLFGYEKTISFYNEHGDLSKQQRYSTHQGEISIEEGNILGPPPTTEKLVSDTMFSYQYDDHGNWSHKETYTVHDPASRWGSVEERLITYY